MSLSAKLRRAPLRAVTGAFILNSGIGKLSADEATAKAVHGMATGTYPFLGKVQPKLFVKGLAGGELALGSALLLPFVSPVVAGAGLAAFSGALLKLYWHTDGMHEPGDPRPTQQGTAIAKDVWMLGIGVGLVADGLLEPAHDKKLEIATTVHEKRNRKAKQSRKAKKAARKARAETKAHVVEVAKDSQAELSKRAQKAASKALTNAQKSDALKNARKASKKAAKRIAAARDEYGPIAAEKAKGARDAARSAAEEYGPIAAEKAKGARDAARSAAEEYGPIAAEKAKSARDAARSAAGEYGPIAADKARQARDAARSAAEDLRDEYGPAVVEKAKQARDAAHQAAEQVQHAAR